MCKTLGVVGVDGCCPGAHYRRGRKTAPMDCCQGKKFQHPQTSKGSYRVKRFSLSSQSFLQIPKISYHLWLPVSYKPENFVKLLGPVLSWQSSFFDIFDPD